MADPHQQLLVGPSAAAETVKLVANALVIWSPGRNERQHLHSGTKHDLIAN